MTLPIVIFCDQVRFEVGNKFSIMGVYDERVLVDTNTPVIPQLTVFMRLNSQDVLDRKLCVKIKYLENDITADHESIQPLAATNKYINMAFNLSPIRVTGKDAIQVFIQEDKSDFETLIASLPVVSEKMDNPEKQSTS